MAIRERYPQSHIDSEMTALHPPGPSAVWQIPVPPKARALSTLPCIDYEDAFLTEVGAAQGRTAEQLARTILEEAPLIVRTALLSSWSAIGLKLRPMRSADFVLGWEIRHASADFVLLGATSRIGMPAELLLVRQQHSLLFDTFVTLENRIARVTWARTEPLHRPVVRHVLAQGAHRIRAKHQDD